MTITCGSCLRPEETHSLRGKAAHVHRVVMHWSALLLGPRAQRCSLCQQPALDGGSHCPSLVPAALTPVNSRALVRLAGGGPGQGLLGGVPHLPPSPSPYLPFSSVSGTPFLLYYVAVSPSSEATALCSSLVALSNYHLSSLVDNSVLRKDLSLLVKTDSSPPYSVDAHIVCSPGSVVPARGWVGSGSP